MRELRDNGMSDEAINQLKADIERAFDRASFAGETSISSHALADAAVRAAYDLLTSVRRIKDMKGGSFDYGQMF